MIEFIEGFPEQVIAIAAKGHVTAADYDNTLIPMLEEVLARHSRVSLYYEIGKEYSGVDVGAAWKDFVIGIGYLRRWARLAVVTNTPWIWLAASVFRLLLPGHLKVFRIGRSAEARAWIGAIQPA